MNNQEIREHRMLHGLSVAECARMVHVSDRTWRRWEAGERNMPSGAWELFVIKLKEHHHE